MKLNMGKPIVAVLIPALIGIISCADNPITSGEKENAESGRSESNGEHAGNGDGEGHEGREGSEGGAGRLVASAGGDEGGEGGESHASREGSENHASSEGSEGSEGQQLAPDQSYDQTRNGARLIMSYSPSKNTFYGIVENTTNQTLLQVRVEVHLSDESGAIIAELGPTWPRSLTPGEKLYVSLPIGDQAFAGWSPHAEVGAGEHGGEGGSESHAGGEGSEGSEGGESGGGEGNETSGHAEGGEGGEGDPSSPILALDESWDGVVNGLRVAMSYDPVRRSFSGIVENAMALTACSVQIELNLKQGTRTVVELGPSPVGDLAPGASAITELLVDDEPLAAGVAFDAWEIHPEVFDCKLPRSQPLKWGGRRRR